MKNIELTKKEGVVLDTSEKYCDDYIYVFPKLQSKTVTTNGKVSADNGYVGLDSVTVNVSTTVELPTLNAPTISLSNSTLTITNPTTNGNFATSFKVYKGSTLLTSTANTSIDLSNLITEEGTYTITVRASGTNFNDSAASNSVSYTVTLPTLSTPTISLVSGTTIQIDTIDDNATTIEVFADGLSIGEVTKEATPLITFGIENSNYSAEEGMTWGAWVASSYNTANFVIANTNQIQSSTGKYVAVADVRVTTDEAIIANKSYMLSSAVE